MRFAPNEATSTLGREDLGARDESTVHTDVPREVLARARVDFDWMQGGAYWKGEKDNREQKVII